MNDRSMDKTLRKTSRVLRISELARGVGLVVATGLLMVLAAVTLDATMGLPAYMLVVVDIVALAAVVGGIGYLVWLLHHNRHDGRRIARRIEQRMPVDDNTLINAVDLAAGDVSGSSVALRELAVDRGRLLAGSVSIGRVIDAERIKRQALFTGVVILATAAALWTLPGVFRSVLPRFLAPMGDHPPFTLIKFDIEIQPAKVYVGRPARILATLESIAAPPEQANVVFLDERGRRRQSLPMLRMESGKFRFEIERPAESRWFYIDTPAGRSERHRLEIHQVPSFRRVVVEYEFPAYTKWPAATSVVEGENVIRALAGTRAKLIVQSNQPLAGGMLTLTDPEAPAEAKRVKLTPTEDASVVEGSFVMYKSGSYRIELTNLEGVSCNDPFRGVVKCAVDQPPEVSIVSPGRSVVVPETWRAPVRIVARDDVAVGRIRLYRGVNGWGPTPVDLKMEAPVPTYAKASYTFDMPTLGAKAGDVISYFAFASDVYPDTPQIAETATYVIRVISQEEYTQHLRARYRLKDMQEEFDDVLRLQQEIERMREKLLKQLKELDKKVADSGDKWSKEDMDRLAKIAAEHDKYTAKLRDAQKKVEKRIAQQNVWDVEEEFKKSLRKLATKLQNRKAGNESLQKIYAAVSKPKLTPAGASRYMKDAKMQLTRGGAGMKEPVERIARHWEDLELLRKAQALSDLVEEVNIISQEQRELADRLGQFRNKERLTPAEQIRARRMAAEQSQLQKQLRNVVMEMYKRSGMFDRDLPKMSASVEELAKRILELGVMGDMADASALAGSGQGRYAHRAANVAATKLETLYKQCKAKGGQSSGELDRKIGLTKQSLSALLKQLSESRGVPGFGRGGGSGSGYYGTRAQIRLMGPHPGGRGGGAERGSGERGQGRADTAQSSRTHGPERGGGEEIAPEAEPDRGAARAAGSAPVRFRGMVEAYFRRLADESK